MNIPLSVLVNSKGKVRPYVYPHAPASFYQNELGWRPFVLVLKPTDGEVVIQYVNEESKEVLDSDIMCRFLKQAIKKHEKSH